MAGSGPGRRGRGAPVVVAVLALDSLVLGMFVPLSLLYLVAVSGESLARVGVLLTVAGALSLPLPLWVGRLVDAHGAKPPVLLAQVLQALALAGYLVVTDATVLFVAALVASVGQRVQWSSVFALVGEITDADPRPQARERWFALIATLRAVGYGAGAAVAGVAVTLGPETVGRAVVAVCAALLAAAAVAVGVGVEGASGRDGNGARAGSGDGPDVDDGVGTPSAPGGYAVLRRDRGYLALVGVNTLYATCNVMLGVALAPTVARALPSLVLLVGPLLVANTVVQATLQVAVARRVRRGSRVRALALAGALWTVWALLVVVALHAPRTGAALALAAGVLCYALAQLVQGPLVNAISVEAAPISLRGRYLAVFQYSTALAAVAAPALFGLASTVSDQLPWLVVAAAAGATVPLVVALARHVPAVHAAPG